MHVLRVRNAHKALPELVRLIKTQGVLRDSRNGPVRVVPEPVTVMYSRPTERVLFWRERDANPFFHCVEGLWMLGGRNDVKTLTNYVARMKDFSDDGRTFHGAYGWRWREHFDVEGGGHPKLPDQLLIIVDRLKKDPTDRRCVLAMWDPVADLGADTKDQPCNTHAYFGRGDDGALNLTVCNRSNDAILGLCGANVVHFSMLQEWMAAAIGCKVGRYWQVTNNCHAYVGNDWDKVEALDVQTEDYPGHRPCPYEGGDVQPYPLMTVDRRQWEEDLSIFLDQGPIVGFRDPFFRQVVTPLYHAHAAYKAKDYQGALEVLEQCKASDWRRAAREWVLRREAAHKRAQDGGVHA